MRGIKVLYFDEGRSIFFFFFVVYTFDVLVKELMATKKLLGNLMYSLLFGPLQSPMLLLEFICMCGLQWRIRGVFACLFGMSI